MQDILTDLDHKPVLASIFRRWLACFIDLLFVILVAGIITVVFGERIINADGTRDGWHMGSRLSGNLTLVLPWLFFLPGIEAFNNGQTIGKMLFRLRTVKEDGSRLSLGRCMLKHLFDVIDHFPTGGIIGMIISGATKKKQRVGDLVAKTIVVEVRK
jgi:uncharacterized RDD family membrane protein YckC